MAVGLLVVAVLHALQQDRDDLREVGLVARQLALSRHLSVLRYRCVHDRHLLCLCAGLMDSSFFFLLSALSLPLCQSSSLGAAV